MRHGVPDHNRKLGLAAQRRANGVTLEEIAAVTKISKFFLEAIEKEDFKALPGGIFDRNYLRQYAAAARLDEGPLLEAYARFVSQREAGSAADENRKGSGFRWLFSLVASFVAAVFTTRPN